jgi:hypothetical protein
VYTLFVPPPPYPHNTVLPGRTCPLIFWFCWRKYIRDNKKDVAFLLVWNKDRYAEKFLVLLACTCVLQPTLVHFQMRIWLRLFTSSANVYGDSSFVLRYFTDLSDCDNNVYFSVVIGSPIRKEILYSYGLSWSSLQTFDANFEKFVLQDIAWTLAVFFSHIYILCPKSVQNWPKLKERNLVKSDPCKKI